MKELIKEYTQKINQALSSSTMDRIQPLAWALEDAWEKGRPLHSKIYTQIGRNYLRDHRYLIK